MITSTLLNVYAPGLALRGPTGSMTKAIKGMKAEQDTMLFFYVAMISCFSIAIMSMFFLLCTTQSAIICNTIFAIELMVMYSTCVRLCNRFKYDAIDAGDFRSGDKSNRTSAAERSRKLTSNPLYLEAQNTSMSGFMMLKSEEGMFSSSSWERKYFVLKHMEIRFYNSRKDYELDEQASVNPRPIDMHFLVFRVIKNTKDVCENKFCIESSTDPDSSELERYVLKCDDDEEFELWKSCLMKVELGAKASLSNEFQVEGDFLDIK